MTVLASILAAVSGLSCVTGTVSFVTREGGEAGVLVPESGAPAFWFAGAPKPGRQAESEVRRLVPGDRLELHGVWKDLAFAPGLVDCSIVRLGRGNLGPAPERSLAEFAGGRLDNTRATLCGVLTAVHPSPETGYAYLTLATPDGPFVAEVLAAAQVLRTLARKVASRNLRVHTRLRGLPEHIPEAVFSELVFIVGEAITNAVKHGRCRTLALTSDPAPSGFVLSVANDGDPFDPEAVLGPEAGHYGLVGMRERARRAGIGLDFAHIERWMVVRLTL